MRVDLSSADIGHMNTDTFPTLQAPLEWERGGGKEMKKVSKVLSVSNILKCSDKHNRNACPYSCPNKAEVITMRVTVIRKEIHKDNKAQK